MKGMVERRSRAPQVALILAALVVVAFLVLEITRVGPPPTINIQPEVPIIGKRTPVTIEISEPRRGLSHVTVELIQGDMVERLLEKSYDFPPALSIWGARTASDTVRVQAGKEQIPGLKAGEASIRVTAGRVPTLLRRPGSVHQEVRMPVRLTPPSLQVISSQTYVAQGGSEVVVYRVGESSVRDGVLAGERWFPGYQLPGASPGTHFAFFAVPYDMSSPNVKLVASDAAGNEIAQSVIDLFFSKKFKEDSVDVSDGFLGKVVPEIMAQTPEVPEHGNLLENYLDINRNLRDSNARQLLDLAGQTRPEILWSRPFLALQNGKVMAGFADDRTYRYQGKVVDHQVHLGYDLAVTRHAPVPAANDGIVLMAKYFGIYGNAVVIDHGCGLMSLYGHLSSIQTRAGATVTRGEIIGLTGETGLAGGDHLHFAILLNGLPVNPVEWWDPHWIADHIARKLGPGFHFIE